MGNHPGFMFLHKLFNHFCKKANHTMLGHIFGGYQFGWLKDGFSRGVEFEDRVGMMVHGSNLRRNED
jgi:hypothetical protein